MLNKKLVYYIQQQLWATGNLITLIQNLQCIGLQSGRDVGIACHELSE